jgi:hypothetical protein
VKPAQQRSLVRYIDFMSRELRLEGWTFYIHFDEAADGANATVTCTDNRKIAHINLSATFDNLTPEEQRHAVIHELLHVHLWEITDYCDETLPEMLGQPVFAVFRQALRKFDEQATDALATALGPKFALWEG